MTGSGVGQRRAVTRAPLGAGNGRGSGSGWLRQVAHFGLCAGICVSLFGCGGATQNVRALRTYAFESPSLPVALDRIEDLSATLELVDRLLLETPYTPGAPWIKELPLTEAKAERLRARLRKERPYSDSAYEIPILKLYRLHLEEVLARAPKRVTAPESEAEAARGHGKREAGPRPGQARARLAQPLLAAPGDVEPEELTLEEDEPDAAEPAAAANPKAAGEPAGASADAKIPEENAAESEADAAASYPSVMVALGKLHPALAKLQPRWKSYAKEQTALIDAELELQAAEKKYPPVPWFTPDAQKPSELLAAETKHKSAAQAADRTGGSLESDAHKLAARPPQAAETRRIAKDALIISSVLTRVQMEALAILPIVSVQTVRSIPSAPSDATPTDGVKLGSHLLQLPDQITGIEERLQRQLRVLRPLAESLASFESQALEATPGFTWKESAVDQITGVTLDSIRVSVAAGAEAFFYSSIGSDEKRDGENVSYSYVGRRQKLDYEVSPILLAYANLRVNFDWVKLPDAVGLDLGFATDRVFSSGGEVERGNLGNELGAEGVASEAINVGLAVLGVKTNVRVANFTAGEAVVRDATTDAELGRAAFKFKLTQIDVGYDLAFLMGDDAGKAYIEQLVVGGRYFDYQLPRILYEFEDQDPSEERAAYTYLREAPPQFVNSKYYMGGITARMGPGETARFAPFFDLAVYIGGGPTSYYFLADETLPDVEGNRQEDSTSALAVDMGMSLGFRYRVFRDGSRLRLYVNGAYSGELIASQLTAGTGEGEKNRVIDFGASDVFHGPRFTLSGAF